MKNEPMRAAIVTIVFGAVLFSLACAPGNQSPNSANVAPASSRDAACDEQLDIDQRLTKVEASIAAAIGTDDELKTRVKFKVRKVGNTYLEVLLEGYAGGKDEIGDLSKIIDRLMDKKCVLTVRFVRSGTLPLAIADQTVDGFEWSACEFPKTACPNGECHYPCP